MRMLDQLQTGWRFTKGLPSSSHGSFFVCVCWKLPFHWLWVSVLSAMDDKMLLLWVGNINRKVNGIQAIEKYHAVWWTKYKEQVDHILQGACEKKWSSIYILESQYDLALMYIFSIMSLFYGKVVAATKVTSHGGHKCAQYFVLRMNLTKVILKEWCVV